MVYRDDFNVSCQVCSRPLEKFRGENFTYSRCPGCQGIFIARAALETIWERLVKRPAPRVEWSDRAGERLCPECHAPMRAAKIREQAIDACAAHGYWFIKGRLMRLLAAG